MAGPRAGIARTVVRRRAWILAAWLAVAAVLLPVAGGVEEKLEAAASIDGSDAARVVETLAGRFDSPFAYSAILVLAGTGTPDSPLGRDVLARVVDVVEKADGVAGTMSYLDTPDAFFVGERGLGTFIVVGLDPGEGSVDAMIPHLRATTQPISAELRARFPHATLRWTGAAALNADLRRVSAEQAETAELRVLPVTLALLLLAFGAIIAAGLPVLLGALAIPLTLGATGLIAEHWSLSVLVVNVVTMIGLGLSIDYALLMVSRFRELLADGLEPEPAAEAAARYAGRTVAMSGVAVAIGFAGLLTTPLNELRSVAVGGLLVAAVAALLATTLLPGLLAWLGARVNTGRIRPRRRRCSRQAYWRRWGECIAQRPKTVLVVAGLPLAMLASQAPRLSTELPRDDWLPRGVESVAALDDLASMGRRNVIQTVRLIVELPPGAAVGEERGWAAVARLSEALSSDPRVERVRSIATLVPRRWAGPSVVARVPDRVRRSLASRNGGAALVEIIPREPVTPAEMTRFARELRELDAAALTGLAGVRLTVGGVPAINAEYEDAVADRFFIIVAVVVLGTFVVLAWGFRSLLVPAKAIALNLFSVAAAFGALVLVFQDGYGAGLVGLDGPAGGVFPIVPVLVFCTVFGLSIDYEVFLVARIAEAHRAGMDDTAALGEGLARTGGVITSAAAIMLAVFAAFMLGDFVLIKMLGFTLAIAVLLDATLIRVALGPALVKLAGGWNWWPGEKAGRANRARLGAALARTKEQSR